MNYREMCDVNIDERAVIIDERAVISTGIVKQPPPTFLSSFP